MMKCFRSAGLQDLNELQRICQTAYSEAFSDMLDNDDVNEYVKIKYSLENLKKELDDTSNHFLFLDVDDKTVGYMKYSLRQNSLEIDRLYLLKQFKGIGAGTEFMKKAEDIAKENRRKTLTLGGSWNE